MFWQVQHKCDHSKCSGKRGNFEFVIKLSYPPPPPITAKKGCSPESADKWAAVGRLLNSETSTTVTSFCEYKFARCFSGKDVESNRLPYPEPRRLTADISSVKTPKKSDYTCGSEHLAPVDIALSGNARKCRANARKCPGQTPEWRKYPVF